MVQGEKRDELCRRVEGFMVCERLFVALGVFLICLDVLAIEMLDHIDVKRYASSIAVAGPLRVLIRLDNAAAAGRETYHFPRPLICFDIIMLIQLLHSLLLQPMFSIRKLANCAIHVELPSSKVTPRKCQHCL